MGLVEPPLALSALRASSAPISARQVLHFVSIALQDNLLILRARRNVNLVVRAGMVLGALARRHMMRIASTALRVAIRKLTA